MLFDLRSAGRRRTVKLVYLGLALLMFVGFVGFSIGSSGLGGGLVDAITGGGGGGGGRSNTANARFERQIQSAQRRANASPSDQKAWADLAIAHYRLASFGDNYDPSANQGQGDYTASGRAELQRASNAWDRYIALDPAKPDDRLARQMLQVFVALNKPDKAVQAQEIITDNDPTANTFATLAIVSYQAGQTRKGDLAGKKALALTKDKAEKKKLKTQLDSAKSQAAINEIQKSQPTPTPTLGG